LFLRGSLLLHHGCKSGFLMDSHNTDSFPIAGSQRICPTANSLYGYHRAPCLTAMCIPRPAQHTDPELWHQLPTAASFQAVLDVKLYFSEL